MEQPMQHLSVQRSLRRAVWIHILLVAAKLGVGFMTGAISLIADGIHSGIDMIAASATATEERQKGTFAESVRQYGEAQADHILAVMEAFLLFVVSCVIIYESLQRLAIPHIMSGTLLWAMAVMVLSTLAHTWLSQRFSVLANGSSSPALQSSALQSRLDVWSSALLLTGLAVMDVTGWYGLDAILACAVSLRLLYTGAVMMRTHYLGFTYIPLSDIEEHRIGRIILDNPGVLGYHNLRVKQTHDTMQVSFHLEVSKDLPSYQACAVSDAVSMSLVLKYGPCAPAIHIERK